MKIDITKFSIKGLKQNFGHDNAGFSCTILYDEKPIAKAFDDGWGGEVDITFTDKNFNEKLLKKVDFGKSDCFGKLMKDDFTDFICGLVDKKSQEDEMTKFYKRLCKTKIVVIMKKHKEGEYTFFKCLYSPEMKNKIVAKYGKDIVEFVNERYL